MTAPTPEDLIRQQIVNEMIVRLRQLQGTGEYVPLTRAVTTPAAGGLVGGGTLEDDRALSLSADVLAQIDKVRTTTWVESSATSVPATPGSIVARDEAGRIRASAPAVATDVATLGTVNDATARMVRTVTGQTPIQISVGSLATHNTATELPNVLYILFE